MMARSKDPFLRNQLFTSTKLSKPRLAVVFSQHYIVSQPKIRSGQHNLQNNQRKINRKTILKKKLQGVANAPHVHVHPDQPSLFPPVNNYTMDVMDMDVVCLFQRTDKAA